MALASSSRVIVRYLPEVTFGVTPATACKTLRVTGESLSYNVTKSMSNEINAYRAVSSMIPTGAEASGDLNGELQYGEFDTLLQGTLQSTYTVAGTNGVAAALATVTVATGTTAPVIAGTGMPVLQKGQWFQFTHTLYTPTGGAAGDPILLRASTTIAPSATSITCDVGTPFNVATVASGTASIRASRLTNGTTQTSYSIERESNDIAQFFCFKGMTPSKMSLSIASGSLGTINFSFMGKSAALAGATVLGAPTASLAYQTISGVTGSSCFVWKAGAALTGTYVKSVKLDYDNTLGAQDAICTLGSIGIRSGSIVCKASIELYFATGAAFFAEFLSNTNQEFVFTAFDAQNNGYVFTLPSANISSYKVNAGGKDSDMLVTVELTALRDAGNADANLRQVMFIDRVGAAVVP